MALKMHSSLAVHPGDWLRTEIVEAAEVDVSDIAASFGVTRQAISSILNGRASLTTAMALRFERAFGIKADTLLKMQARYDLARAHGIVDDEPIRSYG